MVRHLRAALTIVLTLAVVTGLRASPARADPDAGTLTVGQRLINGDGDTAGKCLDSAGAGREFRLQMWPCNGGRQQDWYYEDLGGNYWLIRSRLDNTCAVSRGHGQQVGLTLCLIVVPVESSPLVWIRTSHANGWQQWQNARDRRQCMDVRAHGTENVVQLWDCLNQGNQKWRVY